MDTDIKAFYTRLFKTKGKIRLIGEYKPITKEVTVSAVTATKCLWNYHIGTDKNIRKAFEKIIFGPITDAMTQPFNYQPNTSIYQYNLKDKS